MRSTGMSVRALKSLNADGVCQHRCLSQSRSRAADVGILPNAVVWTGHLLPRIPPLSRRTNVRRSEPCSTRRGEGREKEGHVPCVRIIRLQQYRFLFCQYRFT